MGAIRNAMIETGRMDAKCKLECTNVVTDGDWARVECYLYKGQRAKKPCMYWNVCVYVPERKVHWDTTTFYHL